MDVPIVTRKNEACAEIGSTPMIKWDIWMYVSYTIVGVNSNYLDYLHQRLHALFVKDFSKLCGKLDETDMQQPSQR